MRFDRYTVNDIIFDPLSEEAQNALGKEVYYAPSPALLVSRANHGIAGWRSKLVGIAPGREGELFLLENDDTAYCIIVAKYDDASDAPEVEEDEYEELEDDCDCDSDCGCDCKCDCDCDYDPNLICSGDCPSCHCCMEENTSGAPKWTISFNDSGYEPFSFSSDFINAYHLESEKILESSLCSKLLVNMGIWLYCPAEGIEVCVTAIAINGVYIAASQGVQFLDWETLFMACRFMSGSPCGVKRVL